MHRQILVQPPQIARIDLVGGMQKLLTNFDADTIAKIDWEPPVHLWFTAKNGKKIHSILTKPPAFDASKKYPLLVFPHGGPNAMSKDAFSTRWNYHLLVSQGYVLLQTNYTGSTGFGEKFADDIERDGIFRAHGILEVFGDAGGEGGHDGLNS